MRNQYIQNDDEEMMNQNININPRGGNQNYSRRVENTEREERREKDFMDNIITNSKDAIAKQVMERAQEKITQSWFDKCKCNFEFLQVYFDITTDEVRDRIINSMIPFNPKFFDICHKNPDLYGPFWIYTTFIFIIAASGSLTKYFNGASTEELFQQFIPMAASIIYGIGFFLPFILSILMKCFGSDISFVSVLCIYGYSFSIYIPTVIICSLPFDTLQWLLIGYAVISSTGFLLVNYWKELNNYINNRKYLVLGVIFICQIALFFMLKLMFFAKIKVILSPTTTEK